MRLYDCLFRPHGTLYFGGELTGDKMSLGMIVSGLASLLLAAMTKISVGDLHHSYGGKSEQPHIVSSLYHSMEKFLATPDGTTPPPIGVLKLASALLIWVAGVLIV